MDISNTQKSYEYIKIYNKYLPIKVETYNINDMFIKNYIPIIKQQSNIQTNEILIDK